MNAERPLAFIPRCDPAFLPQPATLAGANRTGSSLCLLPNRAKCFCPLAFSHSLALNSNNGDRKSEDVVKS
jgi:hypothetical protein